MNTFEFPTRQVHLDFHTSEHIPQIGARFDRRQWQRALQLGRVNSITIFAKCHHGWSYYPTKIGRRHPALKTDLMDRQIEACHAIGVRAPLYYTAGWSANDAETHPDWCVRNRDGAIVANSFDPKARPGDPKPAVSWKFLCPTGDYRKLMLDQTAEICARYPVDGFFYDICNCDWMLCFCARCRKGMKAMGLDPAVDADARRYRIATWRGFIEQSRAVVLAAHPAATVFWNGNAGLNTPDDIIALPTHYELEDLPTVWGGYDKFPARAKFFAVKGKPILAMSGKFHTAWGEFGGFKHPDAIRFEAASMIAFGGACSFGDQLHPSGEMDLATYRNIGAAYRYVEQIEAYGGPGALPASNLALWVGSGDAHDEGVSRMLLERQLDFEVIRNGAGLDRYETVVLTGSRTLGTADIAQLRAYLRRGGAVLALGASILDAGRKQLLLPVGGRYLGPGRHDCDYLQAGRELGADLVTSPFLNYTAAPRIAPTSGQVLARIYEPFFSRTYGHYCSHQNTPNRLTPAGHVGALQKGRLIYLPHALGAMYSTHGARLHRDLFVNALRRLHRRPFVEVAMPSAGRVSLLHQPGQRRYVLHLLYAAPLQRGRCQVIEDLPPIVNVTVTARLPEKVRRVTLPLGGGGAPRVSRRGGAVSLTVPEVRAHQMVVFAY